MWMHNLIKVALINRTPEFMNRREDVPEPKLDDNQDRGKALFSSSL